MARLALANSSHVAALSRESHALWGTGLTLDGYRALWEEISACDWATKFARYHVWLGEDGQLLSSAKVYRPSVRLHDREGRCSVFGAIFTPGTHRGRGHAAALVRALLEQSRQRRDEAALLFSDIGTAYYAGLGFRPLWAEEQWGRLPSGPGSGRDEPTLRDAGPEDLELFERVHRASSCGRPLAVVRDREHWEFLWVRSNGFFSRLRDPGVRQRWLVAHRDGEPVGYLITVEGHGEWNVREVGAVDGAAATMTAILAVGAARARKRGLRRFYGWLPREVIAPLTDWSIRCRPRRKARPMLRPHRPGIDVDSLAAAQAVYIPFQDQF